MTTNPTERTYDELNHAYAFFNVKLFEAKLPGCLITMQRKKGAYGYFSNQRFTTRDQSETTDEIALNPSHFKDRTPTEILSTLVHEMVHLWQYRCGKPTSSGYHDKQWAGKMKAVGLIPSATGEPGGKETGKRISHYVADNGPFDQYCKELLEQGVSLPYIEAFGEQQRRTRRKKAASKTKYTCPECGTNAWAKPNTRLLCGDCRCPLVSETQASG